MPFGQPSPPFNPLSDPSPGQVTDGQTSDGPHAVVLTRRGSRVEGTIPRRAAYLRESRWKKRPWGVWVWPWEAGEGRHKTNEPYRLLVWTATTFWKSPQISWRGLTSCNKSPDLTPGQCCHSVEDKQCYSSLGGFHSKSPAAPRQALSFLSLLFFSTISTLMLAEEATALLSVM